MQLSKTENWAYEELKKNNLFLFRIRDLCLLLKINKMKAYNIVKSLKKKRAIESIGKGNLVFKGINEFVVATRLNHPSYVSFWSALNYYGLSDQMPQKIFLATTKYSREINSFKYITLSKKRYFGYVSIGEIVIADKEKTIIDSLLFPKYSGGIAEINECLKNTLRDLDINKLIKYAFLVDSKVVLRRLGFMLETLNCDKKLLKNIAKKLARAMNY